MKDKDDQRRDKLLLRLLKTPPKRVRGLEKAKSARASSAKARKRAPTS
jgi:hypothetical protein